MSDNTPLKTNFAPRRARITVYTEAPRALDHCVLSDYPPGLIDWFPPVEGAWSIREHLIHCADADLHSFVRFGKAIAESGSPIPDWDQEAWRSSMGYQQQSATVSLQIIRLVRSVIATRLGALSEESWAKAACVHPVRGVMTLDNLLEVYTNHIGLHLDFIARNEKLWEAATPEERKRAKPCN